ncbi:DNA-binding protein [Methylococcaceae bacterium CS1]|nr:DNA-binding protein [Methylococcaceae bacterium CS4]TXL03204.1 DNA-binding protein [Methylococcaceae bacterium CS1]
MYSFDASSMIHAWDNYPPENKHFDSLWEWFSNKMQSKEFVISKKAFEEVRHKIPECGTWLKDNNIKIYDLTSESLLIASDIKELLGIIEEKYTRGVGENDLFIIAIAQELGTTLVTEEGRQGVLPALKSNYKIPAVCNMESVGVANCNFLNLLK